MMMARHIDGNVNDHNHTDGNGDKDDKDHNPNHNELMMPMMMARTTRLTMTMTRTSVYSDMATIMMIIILKMTRTSVYSDMASFLCCKASFNSFDCSFSFSWASHRSLMMIKIMEMIEMMMMRVIRMMMELKRPLLSLIHITENNLQDHHCDIYDEDDNINSICEG